MTGRAPLMTSDTRIADTPTAGGLLDDLAQNLGKKFAGVNGRGSPRSLVGVVFVGLLLYHAAVCALRPTKLYILVERQESNLNLPGLVGISQDGDSTGAFYPVETTPR